MIANQSRKRKGFLEPIPDSPFGGRAPVHALRPAAYFINFVTASV
mgnify:FL=1